MSKPLVGLIMGSQSDWPTLKTAAEILDQLGVPFESKIGSAHATPERMATYANGAAGLAPKVIVALRVWAPGPRGGSIGILGGGQLGRMLALAAARLGLKTHIYSDEADAPAFQVSTLSTHAAYNDNAALENFARACHAVTFEFENVPAATLDFVSRLAP